MRSPFFRSIIAGAWMILSAGASAQEATPEFDPLGEKVELPRLVRVQAEFIEVSHETLTKLLLKPREGADDSGLRQDLAKLAEEGKATVVETMLCTGRSGEKSLAESLKEYIYPTEYEPAEISKEIHTTANGGKLEGISRDSAVGPTPTSFETRNLGSSLEIAPTLSENGKIIDLRLEPQIVYHVGNETWAEWKDKRGDASVRMPSMYTARLSTAVTLLDGQPLLVAALSPKGENGFPDFKRKLMVFVRCDVLSVGR
ncbi:hypothetical protein OKA05_18360 [Luteolibacter arcticus]|uniref:Uncharacterized protein n=1 Tax=Luteolibacter arcticus TaxID=1581411 RepID=A0ABT3GLY1_9BACT|nr:hypothetical protein [Luteolibacter arcticus]MCW1924535.1 hypothetical protein [Luteolibacter arcticus]